MYLAENSLLAGPGAATEGLGPPPASAKGPWGPLTILGLSIAVTALYLYGRPYILYNDGDPVTYFLKGWWLVGVGGTDVPSRGPGYPLWLLLTGAASLGTWWGLVLSHIV